MVQNVHFWSFWAKYCHFWHILSNARPKNNVNKVPRWVFRYVGNKTFDFSSKKKDFLPKNDQIWPKIGIFGQFGPGHAGLFNALLWVGWWLWRAGCISQDAYLLYLSSLRLRWNPSCVLSFCISVFSSFCPDLSLNIHLSSYSFILVHWNLPEQTQLAIK